jgi:hypothetical protein
MNALKTAFIQSASSSGSLRPYLAYLLRSRRALIAFAAGLLGLGAALNWSWLIAIGVAPIILATAPCALMCAAGLCIAGISGRWNAVALTDASSNSAAPIAPPPLAAGSYCSTVLDGTRDRIRRSRVEVN